MKSLFIVFFMIFSLSVSASYIKESKVGSCEYPITYYSNPAKCGANCIKLKMDYNCEYHEISDEMVSDYEKPIWATRSMVEVCSGQADCEQKVSEKVCVDERHALTNAEFTETWCNKITGYEQKLSGRKIVVENATRKAAYESAKAQKDAMETGIQTAIKRINHGKRIIALLLVRNAPKNLNKGQIKQMNATYAEIKGLLETGSLETAKDEINAITPDGTIVTNEDKTALIAEIDSFLNN